jgi:hypothetical protein
VKGLVAFVICAALVAPVAAAAAKPTALGQAERLSGLSARRPIRTVTESSARFDADALRILDRSYPRSLQRVDDRLYAALGLLPAGGSTRALQKASVRSVGTVYDPAAHVLRVRRKPAPTRAALVHELVRALVDQNVGLGRLSALRARNRDASLAASAVVDGLASLASGRRPGPLQGSPMNRFLAVERNAGLGPGRTFIGQLRSVGGSFAVASALRTFPQTTEQLLHLDAFLDRVRALPISLPARVDDRALQTSETLTASETFGELDVRALLRAFSLPRSDDIADGWGGGRVALYTGADEAATVAVAVRWRSPADVDDWRAAAPSLVSSAFPAAQERTCPAVDHCWVSGEREVALASSGDLTVLASGTAAELVAAALIR